jgi:hypothetical protein
VAAPQRALALALLPLALLALAACGGKSGPEDPAIAVGTGIPMGAPNATGVRFDAPPAHVTAIEEGKIEEGPTPHVPKALPPAVPDPFDPLEPSQEGKGPEPPPKPSKPPKKGMQL